MIPYRQKPTRYNPILSFISLIFSIVFQSNNRVVAISDGSTESNIYPFLSLPKVKYRWVKSKVLHLTTIFHLLKTCVFFTPPIQSKRIPKLLAISQYNVLKYLYDSLTLELESQCVTSGLHPMSLLNERRFYFRIFSHRYMDFILFPDRCLYHTMNTIFVCFLKMRDWNKLKTCILRTTDRFPSFTGKIIVRSLKVILFKNITRCWNCALVRVTLKKFLFIF